MGPSDASRSTDEAEGCDRDKEHLADVDPDCGCVGVWEHLSERRAADD